MSKQIDGVKVAKIIGTCGKKLKINVVSGMLARTLQNLEENPLVKEVKEKVGEEEYLDLEHTIMTFFALNLLAKTHNTKEFKAIFDECEVEEELPN